MLDSGVQKMIPLYMYLSFFYRELFSIFCNNQFGKIIRKKWLSNVLVLIWEYLSEVPEVVQKDTECICIDVLISKLFILMKKKGNQLTVVQSEILGQVLLKIILSN